MRRASARLSRSHQAETRQDCQAECADNFHSMRPPARSESYQPLSVLERKIAMEVGPPRGAGQPEQLLPKLIRGEASGPRVLVQLGLGNGGAEPRVRHLDPGPNADRIIELRHIGRSHP